MDKKVYLFGNDPRYKYVKSILKEKGFVILDDLKTKPDLIIFPISGVHKDGFLDEVMIDDSFFSKYQDIIFVSGTNTPYLKEKKEKYNFKLIILNELNEFSGINSIATAEGVLSLILKNKTRILPQLTIMVLGYGRSGHAIVDLLTRTGARIIIVARREISRVEAYTMSKDVTSFDEFTDYLDKTDIIVNTVPSLVITKDVLNKCNKDVYIIDIATKPGGVDYDECKKLGINAYLAPGLPGIYAPYSSAYSLVNALIKELGM